MSRIRSIHPGIFTDEKFMEASIEARLLLIGLWTEAWDDGVFEWKPLTLKARIFPADTVNVGDLLLELIGLDFIVRFEVSGRHFGAIRNFRRFQRPKKPNSSGMLPHDLLSWVGLEGESYEPVPHQFPTSGVKSPQMEDGGCRREEKEEEKIPVAVDSRAKPISDEEVWKALVPGIVSTEVMGPAMDRDLSPIYRMIHAGYDFHAVIVPSIREQMAKRKSRQAIGSWDFFRPGVIEYHRRATEAAAALEAGLKAGPIAAGPVRVKYALPPNWQPDPEDFEFGKTCGLREDELNAIRDEMWSWSTRTGAERDDWPDLFRRKAQQKAQLLGRKSAAEQAAEEERRRAQIAHLDERIAMSRRGTRVDG